MIKIAITGNIASGKTFVENHLKGKGFLVYDSDKIVHELFEQENIINRIRDLFSEKVIQNNNINRNKLGEIVFNDKKQMKQLEDLIHPEVKRKIVDIFKKSKNEKAVFVSVPLLYEAGFESLFDYVIMVKISETIQIQRLMKRNSFSQKDAKLRISSQMEQNVKIDKADFLIDNSNSCEETISQIEQLLLKLDIN